MQLFKNNAYSKLAGTLTTVATSCSVTAATGDRFPVVVAPDYFMLTLENAANNIEIVKVTARASGADSMTIVRGQEGTAALAWSINDIAEQRMTAGSVEALQLLEGGSTPLGLRSKLGATAIGESLFTAASQAAARSAIGAFDGSMLPAGTRIPFAQAAAPTGWTQDTSDNANNRMLRVVSSAGGGVAGTHSPILNNVVPAHTHGFTTGNVSSDHVHSVNDPSHRHGLAMGYTDSDQGTFGGGRGVYGTQWSNYSTTGISLNGISSNHTHSGSTDNGSSQTNWTPRYIDLIICSKN